MVWRQIHHNGIGGLTAVAATAPVFALLSVAVVFDARSNSPSERARASDQVSERCIAMVRVRARESVL
jgi:hypothetical protein